MQTSKQACWNLQEDLAAAEAELAGWYETMQRETNALKRIYQVEGHDLLDSPSAAGLGAEGQSPAREGLNSPQATGLVRKMSHNGENFNKTAARQLPQVHFVLLLALPPTFLSIVCAVQDCRACKTAEGDCAVYCLMQQDHLIVAQPNPEHAPAHPRQIVQHCDGSNLALCMVPLQQKLISFAPVTPGHILLLCICF